VSTLVEQRERAAFAGYVLPTLVGTPKQITHARQLRAVYAAAWPRALRPALRHWTCAHDWIEHREAATWGTCRFAVAAWRAASKTPDRVAEAVGGALADLIHLDARYRRELPRWVIEKGPRHAENLARWVKHYGRRRSHATVRVADVELEVRDATVWAVRELVRASVTGPVFPADAPFARAWRARWATRLAAGRVRLTGDLVEIAMTRFFENRPVDPAEVKPW
jgi:hypothetical protein